MSAADIQQFDNADLREALAKVDVDGAAAALLKEGVLLARVEVGPNDRRVLVATSSVGERTLMAFTSAGSAMAWGPSELAVAVIRGADLVEVLVEQGVPVMLIDPAGPQAVSLTVDQLRALVERHHREPNGPGPSDS